MGLPKNPLIPILLIGIFSTSPLAGSSVLTHEAIIDQSWDHGIRPLLVKRFPNSTDEQLRDAHAYAYGGAIIQDLGYYPFGSKFFSDLTHYVRSGDFVAALLRDSQDLNEYAFALGALSHYATDNHVHTIAVNRSVPMMYPKLKAKFGDVVTYEDNPTSHLKVEFSFDVVQVARGKYEPQSYHDFIGFRVAKPVLEKSFQETYALTLAQVFNDLDRALGTYRFTVSSLIPEMTKTAWVAKKDDILKLQNQMTRRKYIYRYSRANYHKEFDGKYDRPGTGARFLAWLIQILPKIGPLKTLSFKVPTPAAEKLFLASFTSTLQQYATLLGDAGRDQLGFVNENFDIGKPTVRGEYHMADVAYDKLLQRIAPAPSQIPKELRADILRFYGASGQPVSPEARAALAVLKSEAQ